MRLPNARTEVPVQVRFDDFMKSYFIDLLVDEGAVFELKSAAGLGPAHRAQLLNYLLLTGTTHGKLVNFRGERVEHEFVNTQLRLADRTSFRVDERAWHDPDSSERPVRQWFTGFLREIGTGLDIQLYEAAAAHALGGDEATLREIDIVADGRRLKRHTIRQTAPDWSLRITVIDDSRLSGTEQHFRRYLRHTTLQGMHWINITRACVTFMALKK